MIRKMTKFYQPRAGFSLILAMLFCVLLAACGSGWNYQPSAAPAAATDYTVSPGDTLTLRIYGEPDLSGDFTVSPKGSVELPLVGAVDVKGRKLSEVGNFISAAYANGYLKNPRVAAEIKNYRPVYLVGEVGSPGSYPYRDGLTLVNAVALAGGFTYRADQGSFEIIRDGHPYRDPNGNTLGTVLLPGDTIRVKERFF